MEPRTTGNVKRDHITERRHETMEKTQLEAGIKVWFNDGGGTISAGVLKERAGSVDTDRWAVSMDDGTERLARIVRYGSVTSIEPIN